jgi:hypothetical protein
MGQPGSARAPEAPQACSAEAEAQTREGDERARPPDPDHQPAPPCQGGKAEESAEQMPQTTPPLPPAVRKRLQRHRDRLTTRYGPFRKDATYQPRNFTAAELALERGVPLRALILSEHEKAVLVAGCSLFSGELRLEAAKSLLPRYRKLRLKGGDDHLDDDDDLGFALAIMGVLDAAQKPTDTFRTVSGKGRPRKVDPWTPSEAFWGLLVNYFIPRELEKRRRALREDDAVRRGAVALDAAYEDDDKIPTPNESFIGQGENAEDTLEASDYRVRRPQPFHTPPTSKRRWPRNVLHPMSDKPADYELHPLDLRLKSGRLTNPNVPPSILESMSREIHQGQREPIVVRIAEIEMWNAESEDGGWDDPEEPEDRSDEMELATFAAQNEEILFRIKQLRETQVEILAKLADTVERVRERFPNDAEIAAAVEQFLEDVS